MSNQLTQSKHRPGMTVTGEAQRAYDRRLQTYQFYHGTSRLISCGPAKIVNGNASPGRHWLIL